MALVISDRVKETTVTTGTGTVTLAGAVTGFRTFTSVLSTNDTTYYAIVSSNEFEVGIGTLTSSSTLTRDTVLSSSNNNLKVDFGAGSKNVFITQPADKAIFQDASGNVSGLDTDNVTEGSTNLYFTNERVDDRVGSLLVAGDNVTLAYDDAAGTLTISATEDNLSNNTTDDLAEGSTNLYYTSARANADFDTRLATKDTDDLSEGTNLYYTDARADARVNLQTGANLDLSSKSTTDLSEGTNLYYTDTRFDTRLATKTTDNLTEGSNLYYTNERVDDRVSNLLQDGTGISFAYDDSNNVLTPTVTLSPFSTTNLSEGTNLYFTNERVDDRVANLLTAGSNITLTYDDTAGTLTIAGVEDNLSNNDTDDLSEGATNLYYTNERVDDRVSALVQNGTGISWSYNDVSGTLTPTVSLSAFSTSDLSEGTNLYYTTARFDSAFSGKSTSDLSEGTNLYYTTARFDTAFSGKDTDDLSEGASNLYYTDTRANAAIDTRVTQSFVNALNVTAAGVQANSVALGTDTTGNYIATIAGTANKISVTGSGSESAAVTLTLPDDVQIANDLTVAGDLTVNGATTTLGTTNLEVSDNLFELNAGLTTAPVNDSGMLIQRGTSDNAIFMWDESADKFTLGTTTSDATVTGNITITTGSLVANLEGNVTGNVTGTVSSLSNHDTGDLAEGSNLYYTDARSRAAISASGDISYDSSTGVISFTQATAPVTSVNTQTGAVVLDTDDISEGASNLYYTAARFNSAFAAKSTSDLSEGTNLYLTQERVEDYVGGMVSGNTETGIAVTYDDTNGKLNFVIDTLNQDTTGNAATATALETARNFSLTGDVTASAVSFDGTANVALSTSIAANTVGITELNVTDGTNGQVLTTDGAGNLSFSDTAGGYGDSDVESYLDGGTSTPTFASATVSGDLTVDTSTLKVDSTNNRVGIGTTSPAYPLHVWSDTTIARFGGTDTSDTYLNIFKDNASSIIKVQASQAGSGAANVAINPDGGNVGIGTSSPSASLGISRASADATFRIDRTGTGASALLFTCANGETSISSTKGGQDLILKTQNVEAARIDSSGRVGIGTTSPSDYENKLAVANTSGDVAIGMVTSTSGTGRLRFADGTGGGQKYRGFVEYAHLGDSMRFGTSALERMRIDSTGNLYYNTTGTSGSDLSDGGILFRRDSNTFMQIATGTESDSALMYFYKKSGTGTALVGSIASRIGDLVIGHGDVGLRFSDGGDSILPAQSSTTGDRDNAIDLGASGARFKDAYLGGNLLVGKTSLGIAGDGLEFGSGVLAVTRDGGVPFVANRRTSDGEVISIRKDNTTVGVIGTQNWGIGTSSPSNKLTIDAGSTVLGGITVSGDAAPSMRVIDTTNSHTLYHLASDDLVKSGSSTNCKYQFMTNDVVRMTIDTSGNVGIGTGSPSYKFHVAENTNDFAAIINNTNGGGSGGGLIVTSSGGARTLEINGGYGDALAVNNGGYRRLTVNSSGNVGIGTSSPDTKLDVEGAIQASESGGDFIRIQTDGNNNIFDINSGAYVFRTSGFAERARILSGGGITFNGDTAAANALDDYEEGEWTPTCSNVTLTGSGGHYTKIGNRVWVTFYLQFPTTSNTNPVQINNLPFTVRNHDSGQARANGNRGGWTVGYSNSGQELRFTASSGTTTVTAFNFDGNTVNNNLISAKSIYGGGYYEVA